MFTKGIFHAKMGSIKDRHGMDLTEAEDVEKRRQEYTEAPYNPPRGDRPLESLVAQSVKNLPEIWKTWV